MKNLAIIFLIFSCFHLWALSNPDFEAHKQKLQQKFNQAEQDLNACRQECTQDTSHTHMQCDGGPCSSQRSIYNQARSKLNEISMSRHVVQGKDNTVSGMKNDWETCTTRCVNDPETKHSREHCRNVVCSNYKSQYERFDAEAKRMDENQSKLEAQAEKENSAKETRDATTNQIRDTSGKVNVLGYVTAGTSLFLARKAMVCAAMCSPPKGCCPKAPMYAGMAVLAGSQARKMFKKKRDMMSTCADLSNDSCGVIIPPQKLPPGCDLGDCGDFDNPNFPTPPHLPNSNSLTPSKPCPPGDTSCIEDKITNPVIPNDASLTADILSKKLEPKEGWPNGKNPFEDNKEFNYDDLSAEDRKQLENSMKGFNQRQKSYMAEKGLIGTENLASSGKNGLQSGNSLAQNILEDELGLSGNLSEMADELDLSGDFSKMAEDGSASLVGDGSNRRKRRGKRRDPSSVEKMKEMLKNMSASRGKGIHGDLGKKSVVVGGYSVGVREDNIFLMVHRMNRKLDEDQRRFIIDF